jgi:transcriptional regulator GlxA family with amidase domain
LRWGIRNPFARSIAKQLCAEVGQQDNLTELGVLSAIIDLLSLLAADGRRADRWPAPWLLRVRDYIEEYCTRALRLDELSEVAGRNPAHLSSEFRCFFGKTISEFVRERRVLRAADLLRAMSGDNEMVRRLVSQRE